MAEATPNPSASPEPSRIGPYRIVRQIGRGGQATVHLAEDMRLRREVALKVLDPGPGADRAAFERFRREAEITSRLDHPGICTVYETGEDSGILWIAMRYVDGDSLAARISTARAESKSGTTTFVLREDGAGGPDAPAAADAEARIETATGPKTWNEIARVVALFEEAARALHTAHEAGVIHRDIKPGNLIVDRNGHPVILDFGLAQETEGDHATLTITGHLMGTPAYMSPEQIAAHRIRLDRRTDVYSLGVSMFECLTLRRPFESPTREGLYQAILTKDPPDIRTLNPAIPSDLEVVVATAIDKDRDRRYQTALDLAEELRRVRMREPILAKPVGPLLRLRRWAQRNPALATAVGGLFAVLATGLTVAVFLLGQRDRALADYDRLGDLSRLQRLRAEAEALWPCEPSRVAAMRAWVDQAASLASRLASHEALLETLRKAGQVVPDSRAGDSRPSDGRSLWRFRTDAEQFQHDTTATLAADLTTFVDPDPRKGLLAEMRGRLAFAESVERETIGKYETKWIDAVRSIAGERECPMYGGLRIRPQLGLIPIGRDPASGLWEFAHLQTAAPGTDPVPERGADGRLIVTESTGIVFVLLPGGTYRMGAAQAPDEDTGPTGGNVDPEAADDESPVTSVTLDPFFISKYEMTQGQWLRFVGRNPSQYARGGSFGGKLLDLRNPVEQVSWVDCDSWIGRLGLLLPTEAQWEYAARGGTTTPRWTGSGTDGLADAANLADAFCRQNGGPAGWKYEPWNDGYTVHAPVGTFAPNPFGLHDVLGNVWEWCRDPYGGYGVGAQSGDGLRNPSPAPNRVSRGGSWSDDASYARSAIRNVYAPELRGGALGVRPALACRRD